MNEINQPITGICLVTKPDNVPTGYSCIRKSKDHSSFPSIHHISFSRLAHDESTRDADLMADSLLGRKDRFVCITRSLPSNPQDRSLILEDIKLVNERDAPPMNYTVLSRTYDTQEKGTARKLICIKMADRQAAMTCICDIVFLYRSKRPPQSYTIIGDINGLQMCVKEGQVPPSRAPPVVPNNIYPNMNMNDMYRPPSNLHGNITEYGTTGTITKKSDEKEILDGIPFTINPKYLRSATTSNGLDDIESFRILNPYEIEQQYYYDFHVERTPFS